MILLKPENLILNKKTDKLTFRKIKKGFDTIYELSLEITKNHSKSKIVCKYPLPS